MDDLIDSIEALRLRARHGGISAADTAFYRAILACLEAEEAENARLRMLIQDFLDAYADNNVEFGWEQRRRAIDALRAALDGEKAE